MTLGILSRFVTPTKLLIIDMWGVVKSVVMLSVIRICVTILSNVMLNVIRFSVTILSHVILSDIRLSVSILSNVMLSDDRLSETILSNVMLSDVRLRCYWSECRYRTYILRTRASFERLQLTWRPPMVKSASLVNS